MHAKMSVAILTLVLALSALPRQAAHGQASTAATHLHPMARLLDEDKPVFGGWIQIGVGNAFADAVAVAERSDIDVVVYDMEHNALDFTAMRNFMQFMVDPGRNAKMPRKTFIARIPAYGRELDKNTWMVKQVLDQGVEGIVFPHIETVDQAFTAVRAMRYPQPPGTPNFTDGIRGLVRCCGPRFWGLSEPEYMKAADIYPAGNLIPWLLIENKLGTENVGQIARALKAKNIKAVLWAGTGDLGASYYGNQQAVAKAVDTILAAGKETGLPIAMNGSANVKQRIAQGARIFMESGMIPEQTRKDAGR